MKWFVRACLAGFLLLIAAGCAHQIADKQLEPVTLPGTGDSQDILREVAQSYMSQFPDRRVFVPDSIDSSGGIKVVGTGEMPIGRVSRHPSTAELAAYGKFNYMEFARVPVVFVVSPEASVKNLSATQLCNIFKGQVTNWKEVGGRDFPIQVQGRPGGGSNMQTIRKHLSCFADLKVTSKANFNLRNSDLVNSMKTARGAIGFMPLSEAQLHGFSVVSLDGMTPYDENYKLGISLGFVYKKAFSPSIQEFVDYLSTDPAKQIMKARGHIPAL